MKKHHTEAVISAQVISDLLEHAARSAAYYVSENEVVRAARRCFQGRIDNRAKTVEIVLTIGKPNWKQREFIKSCKRAGKKFKGLTQFKYFKTK